MKTSIKCLATMLAALMSFALGSSGVSFAQSHNSEEALIGRFEQGQHVRMQENSVANDPDAQNISVDYAERVLDLVNQERKQRNIPPLILSNKLMEVAAIRAEEITRLFSHTRPNGEPCHSLIEDGAYTVGENIAAGHATPEETVQQWMESPGHRANILNEDYTELGVGYAYREKSEYNYYWVQLFHRPMSSAIQRR